MAGLDEFVYTVAPLFGQVGRGIEDAIQGTRYAEAANAYQNAPNLEAFANVKNPGNVYEPAMVNNLNTLHDNRLAHLQALDAAPKLAQFTQDYQGIAGTSNPRFFGDPESRAEMVKAGLNVPHSNINPLVNQGVSSFAQQGASADTLADVFSGRDQANRGTQLSTIALDKDLASGFDTTAKGFEQLQKGREADDAIQNDKAALDAYLNTDVTTDPASMEAFKKKVMTAGKTEKASAGLLKRFTELNDVYKNMTVPDLYAKAERGDKVAARILEKMKADKIDAQSQVIQIRNETKGAGTGDKETRKDVQNDLTYLRSLDRAVATGGKGMIMIDGVPTSFDGSKESLDMLTNMRNEQEKTMRELYPERMKARRPQKGVEPKQTTPPTGNKKAAEFWKD